MQLHRQDAFCRCCYRKLRAGTKIYIKHHVPYCCPLCFAVATSESIEKVEIVKGEG